jgi:periplasmic protein TonB
MSAAVFAPTRPALGATAVRFGLALTGSLSLHILVTSALPDALQSARVDARVFPLTVRLELRAPASSDSLSSLTGEQLRAPAQTDRQTAANVTRRHAALRRNLSPHMPDTRTPASRMQLSDSTIYAARDLDVFPTPLAPIDLARLLNSATAKGDGQFRIELVIDEHGIVQKLIFVEPVLPGPVEREVRGILETARFVPARKDGRAVRSRILLHAGPGPGEGER